ncbi:MAG: hypothetical protein CVV42_03200 [Candidatus Riflebacteria bacterium HGW-Riflebacteria-2]|jgi:hypothetical protein|nr:MAG: hypothetical protein CVV42_03200 [Candidatus Riflebacteria bacterium HGW-Riflebacteria-2]
MALPVILVVMLIVAIFFVTASFMTRNQQHLAGYYLDSENAMNLAESAAQEVLQALRTGNGQISGRPGLKKLFEQLLNVDAGKEQTKTEIEPGPQITRFMAEGDFSHASPLTVKITASLSKFKALKMPDSAVGIIADPKEKEGLLKIEVKAEVGRAVKALNIIHQVKVARITHPVLSRFSLFVKRAPTGSDWLDQINPLHQDTASLQIDPHAYFIKNGRKPAAPVILQHGQHIDLAPDGAYNFSAASNAVPENVHNNAPVFLGGKWRCGLAEGTAQSQFSERFLARMARYDIMPGVDAFDKKARQTGCLSPFPLASIQSAHVQTFGMNDDRVMGNRAIALENTQGFQFYRHHQDNTPMAEMKGSCALRLFGSCREFSPTLVLGDVERYYQRLITMDCVYKNQLYKSVTMPFLDFAGFQRLRYPNQLGLHFRDQHTIATLQGVSGVMGIRMGSDEDIRLAWEFYPAYFGCTLVSEHYMRGIDFVATSRETGTLGNEVTMNNGTPPMPANGVIYSTLAAKAFATAGGTDQETAVNGRNVKISDGSGQTLFHGDLLQVDGYNDVLVRTAFRFASKKDFLDSCGWQENDITRLALPGNVIVGCDNQQVVAFDEPIEIERGGMLVIPGSVILRAAVRSAAGEPLTIVARDQIIIATSQPLELSLIAGDRISKDPAINGFAIRGPLAAQQLDLPALILGDSPKFIRYNKIFSEIERAAAGQSFPRRLALSQEFRQYFGKVD